MREAMKLDLPYLVADEDRHGNVRYYFRRKGKPKVRIKGEAGSEFFMNQYNLAKDGKVAPRPKVEQAAPQTLRWLCQEYYRRSAEYKQLGDRTRHVRKLVLEGICQSKTPQGRERGSALFAKMEEHHVEEIRDERADRPESANSTVKALRQLFKWAKKAKHVTINPAREVSMLRGNADGWHTWTEEEVKQFEAFHPIGTKARLAFGIFRYLGVRRSDAVKLGPGMEDVHVDEQGREIEIIRFTVTKGARRKAKPGEAHLGPKRLELVLLPQLREILDATPSGHMTYLVTEWGKPFTAAGLGNWFRDRCNEAGLPQCSAHGIRKYDATFAAEEGATTHQLMAMFGWESVRQAETYTRKARQAKLARGSMHLLAPKAENKNPAEVSHRSESGTLAQKKG